MYLYHTWFLDAGIKTRASGNLGKCIAHWRLAGAEDQAEPSPHTYRSVLGFAE